MRHLIRFIVAAAVLTATVQVQAGSGASEHDANLFQTCGTCHQIGPNAKHGIGPQLNDIVGRPIGSAKGFAYTPALTDAGKSGKVWDEASLDALLSDPANAFPGTAMPGRVDKAADRQAIIAYLKKGATVAAGTPVVSDSILAIKGDPEYGEYLASECVTCHQADGSDQGIPPISGWPVDAFVTVMHAYKSRARSNPVMQNIAGALGDEEIAALAAWFTAQAR